MANTGLNSFIFSGCEEIAKMLIEKGVDVNAKIRIGYTPLCIAAQNGVLKRKSIGLT